MNLTRKQRAFADAFIETGNASEAARRAGYKEDTAGRNADKVRKNTKVAAYINERLAALEARQVASADEVMQFFSSVMRGEIKDQFGLDPSLTDRISAGKELMKRFAAIQERTNADEARIILADDGGIEVDDGT